MSTIYISQTHPAYAALNALEGVEAKDLSLKSDAKPLQIGFVNLMPTPLDPVRDFGAIFSRYASHDIEIIDFSPTPETITKDAARLAYRQEHMTPLEDINDAKLDAVVLTGFGKEDVAFQDLDFWQEVENGLDDIKARKVPLLASCWGSHAALYHYHGVEKTCDMDDKISGVYEQKVAQPCHGLMQNIDDNFTMAVSRFGRSNDADIESNPALSVLAGSVETGSAVVFDGQVLYLTGHPEYPVEALPGEYSRDLAEGKIVPKIPANVFENDNPQGAILPASWTENAGRLIGNWVDSVAEQQNNKASTIQKPAVRTVSTHGMPLGLGGSGC